MICLVCGFRPIDKCHVRTKGASGCDDELNLMPLCRLHHIEQHKRGMITFITKYPSVMKYLRSKGWELINSVGKPQLFHPIFSKGEL